VLHATRMDGRVVTEDTNGTRVHRIIAALLLTAVRSFSSGATLSTNAPDGKARGAAVSVIIGGMASPKGRESAGRGPDSAGSLA